MSDHTDIYSFDYEDWCKKQEKFIQDGGEEKWDQWERELADKTGWDQMMRHLQDVPQRPPWKPTVWYNKEGDILEITLVDPEKTSPEGSYSEWLNHAISIERDMETHQMVGVQIWDLKKVMKERDCRIECGEEECKTKSTKSEKKPNQS